MKLNRIVLLLALFSTCISCHLTQSWAHSSVAAQISPSVDSGGRALEALSRFTKKPAAFETVQNVLKNSDSVGWKNLTQAAKSVGLPVVRQKLSFKQLLRRGGALLLRIKGEPDWIFVEALGSQSSLIWENGIHRVVDTIMLQQNFAGEALIPFADSAQSGNLWIEKPVRQIPVDWVGGSQDVVETFTLHNRGREALNVRVASTSCGCTGAEISPNPIQPGQTATLIAKMHAEGGSRIVTVSLASNDSRQPRATVALQTLAPKELIPAPHPVFINARKGKIAFATGSVFLPRTTKITEVISPVVYLKARLDNPSGDAYPIILELMGDAPEGALNQTVELRLQGSSIKRVYVPVSGYVSNDITAEPSMLVVGTLPKGASERKTIIVAGPSDKPFSIRSVTSSNPNIEVQAELNNIADSHNVVVIVRSSDEKASLQGRISLTFSDNRTLDIDVFPKS